MKIKYRVLGDGELPVHTYDPNDRIAVYDGKGKWFEKEGTRYWAPLFELDLSSKNFKTFFEEVISRLPEVKDEGVLLVESKKACAGSVQKFGFTILLISYIEGSDLNNAEKMDPPEEFDGMMAPLEIEVKKILSPSV